MEEGFRRTYSVSEITSEIAAKLEREFSFIWVEGEITSLRTPASGHIYFTLTDDDASLRCVMFKQHTRYLSVRVTGGGDLTGDEAISTGDDSEDNSDDKYLQPSLFGSEKAPKKTVPFKPAEGQHVLVMGRLGVYAARGEYQLVAEVIEPVGIGAVTLALEQLKEELKEKGYFDEERKRPLPFLPNKIALVTSPTGAALFDILKIIYQRHPGAQVVVVPTRVQGSGAEREIAHAIDLANRHEMLDKVDKIDVIICGRGGGSMEDLMPFNSREVADAAFRSKIPIISAVGHEIDFSILDLTADVRAPTPTAAAEMVVPRVDDILMTLDLIAERLTIGIENIFSRKRSDLVNLLKRLRGPEESINEMRGKVEMMGNRLLASMQKKLGERKIRFSSFASALTRLSPTDVLSRGYAVVRRADTGEIILNAADIEVGETANIKLHSGALIASVVDRDVEEK